MRLPHMNNFADQHDREMPLRFSTTSEIKEKTSEAMDPESSFDSN
jgi:hypothetical protein